MQKILILGGTSFIGRNLVERLSRHDQCDLTLLNRGKTSPDLFSNIEQLHGDRNKKEIAELIKDEYDFVIDVSCYYPHSLQQILDCFSSRLKKYIFVSTCSVYESSDVVNKDEDQKLLDCPTSAWRDESPSTYGMRKAACESLLMDSGHQYSILRPALVYGQYDPTDRLYYWLYQVYKGNTMCVPNNGEQQFSISYVHDVVHALFLALTSDGGQEIFNLISQPATSIKAIISAAQKVLSKSNEVNHITSDKLHAAEISQWTDFPLWIDNNTFTFSNHKIRDAYAMQMVEFEKSIRETIAYYDLLGWPEPKYGLSQEEIIRRTNGS